MSNKRVIEIFTRVADILEIKGENRFKILAYRKAAGNIEALGMELQDYLEENKLSEIPGVGKALQEKIIEIVRTGELELLERIEKDIPEGLLDILLVPGVGPKKTALFHRELGINNLEELKKACSEQRLQGVKGLGPKVEENILSAIENLSLEEKRLLLDKALSTAKIMLDYIGQHPDVLRISQAGSLRRWRETIGDLDILVAANSSGSIMEWVRNFHSLDSIIASGKTKTSIILEDGVQVDVRVVPLESFGAALQYFTGSKAHNVKLRGLAKRKGLRINEYGVFNQESGEAIPGSGVEEENTYAAAGLPWIPPELREDTGEIEAAQEGSLPRLFQQEDIKGDLHIHSLWSDGINTIDEIAAFARDTLGYQYIAIADHSESERIGSGLDRESRFRQLEEIEELQDSLEGIKVFKSMEVNILKDGSLDAGEDIMDRLDFAVASIHSHFKQPREETTARFCRALEHPKVRILAHPFARRLYLREPVDMDFEAVVETARKNNVSIEINSCAQRLDLDWSRVKNFRDSGIPFSVNSDGHNLDMMKRIELAVSVARRGWLEKRHVLNSMSLEEFEGWLRG
jgi:DNA polymerase (family X)